MPFTRYIQQILPELPDSVPDHAAEIAMLKNLPFDELLDRFVHGIVSLAINIALAIVVFYAGKFIIGKLYNVAQRMLTTRHVDSGLRTFLLSMIKIVLYFILVVTTIGILGIETSSFLAIFASAGVAVGMALSGTLQNFAGGVLILLLKPYRVGNYIEAQGYAGTVKEIQIFHTVIVTYDNKSIIIPNGGLSTGSVNNWSREQYRRVDWEIGISYGDDIDTARRIILDILCANPSVITECSGAAAEETVEADDGSNDSASDTGGADNAPKAPLFKRLFSRHRRHLEDIRREREEAMIKETRQPYAPPSVVVNSLADSAVMLKARAWVRTPDYWAVYYAVNEAVYRAFADGSHGVSFPFPQLDVRFPDGVSLNPANPSTELPAQP